MYHEWGLSGLFIRGRSRLWQKNAMICTAICLDLLEGDFERPTHIIVPPTIHARTKTTASYNGSYYNFKRLVYIAFIFLAVLPV
jgi:hypothetical protein